MADSSSKNKKIAVIGVSSILLVAAVVGAVTYGVSKRNVQEGDNRQVSTSSKAAHKICQSTDYQATCEKSLANAKDADDPHKLIQVAFQAAIDGVKEVLSKSSLLKEAAKDPRTSKAFDVCKEVLDSSIEDIQRSSDKIATFDKTKIHEYLDDITTWLSGSITYQQTCLDAFENTTGDTGEKMKQLMKTTSELSSNGLAMVTHLNKLLGGLQIPDFSRKLLRSYELVGHGENGDGDDYYADPGPLPKPPHPKRGLLQADPKSLKPNVVVAQDGTGNFKTIQEAVNSAPKKVNSTFLIFVKAGVYKEYVEIPKGFYNIFLLGEGPTKTKITGNKNFVDGTETFRTATVIVNGDNFIAKDIGFENTAGAIKHQAVALRVSADRSIFYNCQIDGYQDTLYAHTHRQFYRDCTISGTIDFIFGDAAAVFQNCKLVVRKPMEKQGCMVTAQGRTDPRGKGATVLQNCTITAEPAFLESKPMPDAFLGRPWKNFSRTVVMQSNIDSIIVPEGWSPWSGDFALDTLSYAEYENRGPGAKTDLRVKWSGIKKLTPEAAASFTPASYIEGGQWIKASGVPYVPGMIKN